MYYEKSPIGKKVAVSHIQLPLNHVLKSSQKYLLINWPPEGLPVDFYFLWSFAYKIYRMRVQFVTDCSHCSLPDRGQLVNSLFQLVESIRAMKIELRFIFILIQIDEVQQVSMSSWVVRSRRLRVRIAGCICHHICGACNGNLYSCRTRRNNLFCVVGKCLIGKPSSGRISIVRNGL